MTNPERFFIRPDYVPNAVKSASPDQEYWTERRIETSTLFQYSVYAHAARLLRRTRNARVLDIGCGTARKAQRLLIPSCAYYRGVDQGSAIDYCKRVNHAPNAEFVVDDLEAPARRDGGPYDLVICADVIEHLGDPRGLLRYAHDMLASRGTLVISTPERDVMHGRGITRSPNPEHVREWNREEFAQLLVSHGFKIRSHRLAPQFRMRLSRVSLKLVRGQMHRPVGYWGCQIATCSKD
jgi:SAM-dependent methyltransferase